VSLSVFGVVNGGVGIHCGDRLVVVHWIGMVSEAHFSEFLAESSFSSLELLSALSLAVPVFDSSSFYSALIAAIFF
jgi:hypothetical protein